MSFGIVSGLFGRVSLGLRPTVTFCSTNQAFLVGGGFGDGRNGFFPSPFLSSGQQHQCFERFQVTHGGFSQQRRSFSSSPLSQIGFRKYLRDVPKPSPERRAEIEAQLQIVKQFADKKDPNLTFEMFYPALRDTYLHRGAVIKMSKVALLLDKIKTQEHLTQAVKLLKHLQRGGYEFGRHVSNNFISAVIRVDLPDVALDLLHRSVADRGNIDEEPLYRLFPSPTSYEALINTYIKKGDLDKALKAFSIAAAQHRDNPDKSPSWPNVFLSGMKCYWKKKDYGTVRILYQEVLHRKLPDLPGMIILLARIEAQKKEPNMKLLYGYRVHLEETFRIAETSLFWNELTALIAYAANDRQVAKSLAPSYRDTIVAFLQTFLEPDRVTTLFADTF